MDVATSDLEVTVATAGDAADVELDAFFETCPTSFAQQSRHWRDVITPLAGDQAQFLLCRAAGELVGVLPSYRYEGPLGAVLNSVPQPGPLGGVALAPGAPREAVYEALLTAYASLARDLGCAVASVISNPFWPDDALYRRFFDPEYTLENSCLALDLEEEPDSEELPPGASSHLRRNLRRARSGALFIDDAQTRENVDEFVRIHEARHAEIGVHPLPRALFSGALEHMTPADKARFFFVRRASDDAMLAGGFYVHHAGVIDALMPAVASEDARLGANYLMADHSIRWARERGLRFYNWQGSPPTGGVARWKRQWGSREYRYAYFAKVTGDVEPFLRSTPQDVLRDYRWHFVLPFDRIGCDDSSGDRNRGSGRSTRRAAWSSLETRR